NVTGFRRVLFRSRQRGDPSLELAVGSRTGVQQHGGSQGTDVVDLFGQLFLGASVDGEVEAYAKELSLTPGKGSSHLAGVLSRYLGLEIFQFALLSGGAAGGLQLRHLPPESISSGLWGDRFDVQ